jgi:hypothetical protein
MKTRYKNARPFLPPSEFDGIRARDITTAEGVIFHTVAQGDRLDALAQYYYNDSRLWWRIVDANPEVLCGYDMLVDPELKDSVTSQVLHPSMLGRQIRIPREND